MNTGRSDMDWIESNRRIWDQSYDRGLLLWYPSEALVRIVRTLEHAGKMSGLILDHGCGSGNIAEFLVRSGHKVHCTDISAVALETTQRRFRGLMLPAPTVSLIDQTKPLGPQLPDYGNLVIWQSLYYGTVPSTRQHLRELIGRLPRGGSFITAFPTRNDVAYTSSRPMPDGSREFIENVSGQMGAVVSVPESAEELAGWCEDIAVEDIVTFGIMFRGVQSEFYALYGFKR
jgi:SAM-dependent methyltransferase